MLAEAGNEVAVPSFRRLDLGHQLRSLRKALAACMMLAYLLAGTLHGACDLDVANPVGKSEIASVLDGKFGHSDQQGSAGHHCHGCFSVVAPQPVLAAVISDLSPSPRWPHPDSTIGTAPDTDSRPPKQQT